MKLFPTAHIVSKEIYYASHAMQWYVWSLNIAEFMPWFRALINCYLGTAVVLENILSIKKLGAKS